MEETAIIESTPIYGDWIKKSDIIIKSIDANGRCVEVEIGNRRISIGQQQIGDYLAMGIVICQCRNSKGLGERDVLSFDIIRDERLAEIVGCLANANLDKLAVGQIFPPEKTK
jgi:hypothetical protein